MTISNKNKLLARNTLQAFGGDPNVSKYWDEKKVSNIDLLSSKNKPYTGITSYSTIGLSDYSIGYSVDEKLRTEIVGASETKFEFFPNILSTCAFYVINSKFSISHGQIFKDVIKMYYPNIEMEHVLFTSPFIWDGLTTIDFPDKKIAWLLMVPISSKEFLFSKKEGIDALEDLFEEREIDIFDLNRKSIL